MSSLDTPEVRARSTAGLALLLLGSGAAALVYQVLWLRLLALVFGVTVYAATTVLASFMAGLALGSAIAGRIADRARSPLRCFGLVEIGVGVLALLTQPALTAATPLYVALQAVIPDTLVVHVTVRFLGSFLVLLAPASASALPCSTRQTQRARCSASCLPASIS